DRTRLIVNLAQLTGYDTRVEGNELVLTLGVDNQTANVFEPATDDKAPASRGNQVSQIDFRRGETGEGRIVVNLSNPSIPVDVREERGRIQVRFVGAAIPEALRRRLDVTDFATPVRYVDASMDGDTGVVSIEPTGNWEYLAYQADSEFSINVKPVTEAEESRRRRDAFQYTGEKLS